MRTTAIFVEHLAIGLQSALWMALVVAAWFGYDWMLVHAPAIQVLVVVPALFVVYPVGIFMDEFSDLLFSRWSLRIRRKYVQDDKQTAFALLVQLKDSSTSQYFQYLRSRIRIARSSALNFFCLTGATVIFTLRQFSQELGSLTVEVIILEFIVGILLMLSALFSWWRVSNTFAKRIQWGYDALQGFGQHRDRRTRAKKST